MAFAYPRFNGETDAATHIRMFLNVWNANHMAQSLSEAVAHQSKMTEFGLTLDGRAAFWHSQMDLPAITTFDQLQSAFLRFFHRRVPQREILGQFYTIKQLPTETIADFSLRFQNLRRKLERSPAEDEARETFLAALRRPIRATLNNNSVKGETTDMVIERALQLELDEEEERFSMSSLRQALPQDEERQFRQAIQCTICLNSGHSAVECNMRIHCPICHSKAHTVDQCEYNMLNRAAPTVRSMDTQRPPRRTEQRRQEDRPRYMDRNPRDDRHHRNRRNHNDSEEDEPEDEDYRGHPSYAKGGRRYENHRPTNKRGGFNGYRGKPRQYRDHRRYDESSGDERHQEQRRDQQQPPRTFRQTRPDREEQVAPGERHTPPGAEKGESSIHCFICQQPGHYATQCPARKGKGPAVNTITAEVQQVTTRQQTKTADWAAQDEVRRQAQAWVEKANATNTERMRKESANTMELVEDEGPAPDPIWQALAGCEITLTMEKLLQLVPRFRQTMEEWVTGIPGVSVATKLTEVSDGPSVVDHHNPAITLILHGQEIPGCVIDGGSGVNVISVKTCEQLGISEWEACPFWLRMADTRSVRPLGLIRKVGIIVGGHRFDISAVVLALDAPGAYPMLLGRPWLRSTNIKQS